MNTAPGANVDAILASAAGCGSTLKEYGRLFAHDPAWAAPAAQFAEKVRTDVLVSFAQWCS